MVPGVVVHLWFSRLVLSGQIGDAYALHQLLWKAYDGYNHRRCFLYRADVTREPQGVKILVQATWEARWSALIGPQLVSAEQVYRGLTLTAGEQWRFFLRANPTAWNSRPSDARGNQWKRSGLLREPEQRGWLAHMGERVGFSPTDVRISNSYPYKWARNGTVATHVGADFSGLLTVTDPEKLSQALQEGIGPAKAFGFGLLSLAQR